MSNDITSQRAHEEGIHSEMKTQKKLALVVQNSLVLVSTCFTSLVPWRQVGA